MATHSSVLAWRIPGTVEAGGLPSMGSHRVRHDWSNLAAAAAEYIMRNTGLEEAQAGIKIAKKNINMRVWSLGQEDPLEEEMATTPVLLPGESCGQRSLAGYSHGISKSWSGLSTHAGMNTPLVPGTAFLLFSFCTPLPWPVTFTPRRVS